MSTRLEAPAPLVVVVVVTWNGTETSRRCLLSLRNIEYENLGVCLVDNGSDAGFQASIAQEFPEVQIESLPENSGYAGGSNAGIDFARRRGAEYVLLLNDDTTVDPDAVKALIARASADPTAALIAPKILIGNGIDLIWSAGGYIRRPWFKADHFAEGSPVDTLNRPRELEWASGCALFFPVSLVDSVGPMDERYFLYLEDVDWCLRIRKAGFRIFYEPAAIIRHEVSASAGQLDPRIKRYYSYRNYYLLTFTHSGFFGRAWFGAHYVITLAKTAFRWLLFPGYRSDSWYHARTRGLFDVLRRRWGKAPYADDVRTPSLPVEASTAGV